LRIGSPRVVAKLRQHEILLIGSKYRLLGLVVSSPLADDRQ